MGAAEALDRNLFLILIASEVQGLRLRTAPAHREHGVLAPLGRGHSVQKLTAEKLCDLRRTRVEVASPKSPPSMSSDYLFPHRLGRRDFLKLGALAAASTGIPALSLAQSSTPVKIGSGKWTY